MFNMYMCKDIGKTIDDFDSISDLGWLGKLPVPGRPTNLDYSRVRAYCAYSRCGWGCLDIFSLVYHICFLSPSL